jgi:hypothetical protein
MNEVDKEKLKSSAIGYFVIGTLLLISGYILWTLMQPAITIPLPSDYVQRVTYSSMILIVFSSIGGLCNLLGIVKLVEYNKA